ncbi:hypothetical protein KOI35_15600 [Actinoplanes bogorensis]|uniref:ABC transporter permease n=1 Tax=Paractinoplanes bogorensis TaxID=1610840 RepID=A0ABS5YNB1_9ACTN|nr:hypothetical protein [Actinoplanes bogorensis]MBU2664927.1 hypothetical protein [Actinoplanes bogorensis]
MTRILGIELRRSNALTLAALLIGVGGALLVLDGGTWRHDWLRFAYSTGSSLFLLLPLALAGGAVLGRREKRTRADELIASTARPRAQRLTPALLAIGIAAAAAHLLLFAAGAILIAVSGSYLSAATLLWPLTGVLVLAGGTWLGLAAGRAWSSPLVPPLVAVLGLLLQFAFSELGPIGEPTRMENLSMLAQPPFQPWEAISGRALAGYALLGAGLLGAGFLLAAGRSWIPRVAAVAVLGLAGWAAMVVPGVGQADRYRVDAGAIRLVCADGTPQVCVTAVHAWQLDKAAPQVREALQLLAKLPGAQTKAIEWHADRVYQPGDSGWDSTGLIRTPADTVSFDLNNNALVPNMLLGAGTGWNGCAEGPAHSVAGHAAGAWLMGTDVLTGVDDFGNYPEMEQQIRDTVRGLRALPEAEQVRRVTALRDAAQKCENDLMPYLTTAKAAP